MSKRKSLLALIGTVVLLVSLAVPMMQCAPEEAEEEEEAVVEEGIKYGGRLNVGCTTGQAAENLVCGEEWQWGYVACMFWQLTYDQLWIMGPAPDYEPLPMLATSWETEDGKTWAFHLRHDAAFHDGVPVTAEDVAFTMKYLPTGCPVWCFADADCEPGSIKLIDDYTVEFTLKKTLVGLYPPFYWFPIFPKHIWEPYKDDMLSYQNYPLIGSGPFKLKEFKPAEYMWLEANEDYWGDRPYVDEVVFKSYGSFDAICMAMKRGEVDMLVYDECPPLVAEDLRETENIEVLSSPSDMMIPISFNLHKDTPLQDSNVRKAIMHGIDRDRIIDMVYLGYAEKLDSIIYPELADHNPNLPQYEYSPDLAKNILNEGGYVDTDGDGIRNDPATRKNLAFELLIPAGMTNDVKMATIIKEELKHVGIDITIKASDYDTYRTFLSTPEEDSYEMGIGEIDAGPYANWVWDYCRSYPEGKGWNNAYYNNPEFDELLDKMLAESDVMKRREYLYEMQMMLAEDLPYGWLVRPQALNPVRTDKLEGWVETMGGISTWINPWTYFKVHLK